MKKLILIIFFSIIFLNQSYATTLIQALSKAYKDNPKLNAERENLKISEEEINEAKSEFLPTITISGYISDENTTKLTNRSGANVQSTDVDPSQESILIEQTLFQGLGGVANLEKSSIGFGFNQPALVNTSIFAPIPLSIDKKVSPKTKNNHTKQKSIILLSS